MEMMLRASKNIARLMARYSGERVEGKCDFTEKKVGEIDFDVTVILSENMTCVRQNVK